MPTQTNAEIDTCQLCNSELDGEDPYVKSNYGCTCFDCYFDDKDNFDW